MGKKKELNESIECLKQSLEIKENLLNDDDIDLAETSFRLGEAFRCDKKLDDSLKAYKNSIKIFEMSSNSELKLAKLFHSVGMVYIDKKEFEKAIKYFERSKDLYKVK